MRVSIRQEGLPGWDQEALANAKGLFIGAGGINGEICEGVVMKGLGVVEVCDFDIVEESNLNRQKFTSRNLDKNKAIELCKNLSRQGSLGSTLYAHPCSFQNLDLENLDFDFMVCGVDNQLPKTRLEVCRFAFAQDIPAVILGVTEDADKGYVFVQEAGKACWACAFKPELEVTTKNGGQKCPNASACVDILKTVAGPVLYAIDTLVMGRKRDWNYWYFSLSQPGFGGAQFVQPRPDCAVCGQAQSMRACQTTSPEAR